MSLSLLAEIRSGKPLSAEAKADLKKVMSKNLVKSASMGHELQSETLDLIISALDSQTQSGNLPNYENAAKFIKDQMDKKFGGSWQCIIGEAFGFNVTYQLEHMLYFYYQGLMAVLLFKA
jgi:dynein light chain 4, axonemal